MIKKNLILHKYYANKPFNLLFFVNRLKQQPYKLFLNEGRKKDLKVSISDHEVQNKIFQNQPSVTRSNI